MGQLNAEEFFAGKRLRVSARRIYDATPKLKQVGDNPPLTFTTDKDILHGDCTLFKGAQFQYAINGANGWFAKVSSTDTGDEAGVWVALMDDTNPCDGDNGVGILTLVGHYGLDIHDANVIKDWQQEFGIGANQFQPGIGPLEVYTRATCAIISFDC
jgi:hypothetical protein